MNSSPSCTRIPETGISWKANAIQEANTIVRDRSSLAPTKQPVFSITTQTITTGPEQSLDGVVDDEVQHGNGVHQSSKRTPNGLTAIRFDGNSTAASISGTADFRRFPASQAETWKASGKSGADLYRKALIQGSGSSSESERNRPLHDRGTGGLAERPARDTAVQNSDSPDLPQSEVPARAQMSPSPPWSSDSDNSLTKGLIAGKSIDVLRKEFPNRRRSGIEKRQRYLAAKGVFGKTDKDMASAHETVSTPTGLTPPTTAAATGALWSQREDDILIAGVKAGETTETTAQRLHGRSVRALLARTFRLVESKKITEAERQAVRSLGSTLAVPLSGWTSKDDESINRAVQDKKTAFEIAQMFPERSPADVFERRKRLIIRKAHRDLSFPPPASASRSTSSEGTPTLMAPGRPWTIQEESLLRLLKDQQLDWGSISSAFDNRSESAVSNRWSVLERKDRANGNIRVMQPATPLGGPGPNLTTPISTPGKAGTPWTDEEDDRLIEYVQQGIPFPAMAGRFGNRSVGSFANRHALLVAKGKGKSSNSGPVSLDTSVGQKNDDPLNSAKSGLGSKALGDRKRPHRDDLDDASSDDDVIQIRRSDRPRRTPRNGLLPSDDDKNEDASTLHPAKRIRTSASFRLPPHVARGATLMRGVSRPSGPDRQQAAAAARRTDRRNSSLPGPSNSIDRLSNALTSTDDFDGAEDADTIHVSRAPNPGTAISQSAVGSKPRDRTNNISGSLRPPSSLNNGIVPPIASNQDLDETLISQQEEINALEARLAKVKSERVKSQAQRIAELKRQIEQYDDGH